MMNKTIPVFDEAGNYIKDVFPSPKRAGYLDKAQLCHSGIEAMSNPFRLPQYWSLFFCPRCHEQTNCALPK